MTTIMSSNQGHLDPHSGLITDVMEVSSDGDRPTEKDTDLIDVDFDDQVKGNYYEDFNMADDNLEGSKEDDEMDDDYLDLNPPSIHDEELRDISNDGDFDLDLEAIDNGQPDDTDRELPNDASLNFQGRVSPSGEASAVPTGSHIHAQAADVPPSLDGNATPAEVGHNRGTQSDEGSQDELDVADYEDNDAVNHRAQNEDQSSSEAQPTAELHDHYESSKATDGPKDHDTYRHACQIFVYTDPDFFDYFEESLFPSDFEGEHIDGFLDDLTLFRKPLKVLLERCRNMLITDDSSLQLVLSFDRLGLEIGQDNTSAGMCCLENIVDVYIKLFENQGMNVPDPLYVKLTAQEPFFQRFCQLRNESHEGKTFDDIALPDPYDGSHLGVEVGADERQAQSNDNEVSGETHAEGEVVTGDNRKTFEGPYAEANHGQEHEDGTNSRDHATETFDLKASQPSLDLDASSEAQAAKTEGSSLQASSPNLPQTTHKKGNASLNNPDGQSDVVDFSESGPRPVPADDLKHANSRDGVDDPTEVSETVPEIHDDENTPDAPLSSKSDPDLPVEATLDHVDPAVDSENFTIDFGNDENHELSQIGQDSPQNLSKFGAEESTGEKPSKYDIETRNHESDSPKGDDNPLNGTGGHDDEDANASTTANIDGEPDDLAQQYLITYDDVEDDRDRVGEGLSLREVDDNELLLEFSDEDDDEQAVHDTQFESFTTAAEDDSEQPKSARKRSWREIEDDEPSTELSAESKKSRAEK